MEIKINSESMFDETIKEGTCLVDFYATWCGPCRMLAPFVEEISEEYEGKAKVCKIDVDEVGSVAQRYEVRSIPTLLYFKDGKLITTNVGFQDKTTICQNIDECLKN